MPQKNILSNHINIAVSHVSFTYPTALHPLFEDVSLSFPHGCTAVLGDNGIGKTTFIHLLLGTLTPTAGTISPNPATYLSSYCPQETDEIPATLEAFAADWTPDTLAIRNDLGIGDDWAWRFETLSGGEKKRLQVACALATQPDVLVLDEPTNHVDGPTRTAIATAIQHFKGISILISHDVELIDDVANRCLFFERRHSHGQLRTALVMRPGNYTEASAAQEQNNLAAARDLESARQTAVRVDATKANRKHEAAQAFQKRRGDKIDPKDHDARAKRRMAILVGDDARAGAASARIDSQVEAAHRRLDTIETAAKRYDGDIFIDSAPSSHREVLHLGEHTLPFDPASPAAGGLHVPELSVGPRDHIGIRGPNGTGKSTLIRNLLAHGTLGEQSESVPMLVIAQETGENEVQEALSRLAALDSAQRGRVLSHFAQLNSDPDRLLTGEAPSPGELRKLLVSLGIETVKPQLIVMDEPTNHLDLHSIDALSAALAQFPGALLVVSHNERFLASCTSTTWSLDFTPHTPNSELTVTLG